MQSFELVKYILKSAILGVCLSSLSYAYENPLLTEGKGEPDGLLGSFSQNNTGDCFFLASVIAIAQDSDGPALIKSAFHKDNSNRWKIIFPGLRDQPIDITEQDFNEYKLINSDGHGLSEPVRGDPDIKILEIAADKLWKSNIKSKGLWDDVPMNALFMFSQAEQLLIWNRAKATKENNADIDKYERIPEGIIKEVNTSSPEQTVDILKTIVSADTDGISMILIDYINYHAVVITNIDFDQNIYSYIDTTMITYHNQNLDNLLQRLSKGQYAINYVEITPF